MKKIKILFVIVVLAFSTFSAVLGTRVLSEERITTDEGGQDDPAIYGDIVVWSDYRNDNGDIWGYNLKTKEEFRITTDTKQQIMPAIYGDIVVWQDERNDFGDIWGYNLKTKEEFRITTDSNSQYDPAIYCDRVVWEDDRNDYQYDIYLAYLDVICETAKKSLPIEQIMKILGLLPK